MKELILAVTDEQSEQHREALIEIAAEGDWVADAVLRWFEGPGGEDLKEWLSIVRESGHKTCAPKQGDSSECQEQEVD